MSDERPDYVALLKLGGSYQSKGTYLTPDQSRQLADDIRLTIASRDAAKVAAEDLLRERDALRKLLEKHHDAGHYLKMSQFPAVCPACEKYGGDVLTPDGFWKSPSDPAMNRTSDSN